MNCYPGLSIKMEIFVAATYTNTYKIKVDPLKQPVKKENILRIMLYYDKESLSVVRLHIQKSFPHKNIK